MEEKETRKGEQKRKRKEYLHKEKALNSRNCQGYTIRSTSTYQGYQESEQIFHPSENRTDEFWLSNESKVIPHSIMISYIN